MAYCSTTAIMIILPSLPNTTSMSGHSQTVQLIEKHVNRADSIINSKCARRYSVPFDPVPSLIRSCSEEITAWFVYRSEFGQSNRRVSKHEYEYRDAMDWLDSIFNGELSLVDTSGSLVNEMSTTSQSLVDSNNIDYQSFFDEDDVFKWKVDSDKLDSIDENR